MIAGNNRIITLRIWWCNCWIEKKKDFWKFNL